MYNQLQNDRNPVDISPDPRYVYKGDGHPLPSDVLVRKNRPSSKKRSSPLRTIVLIFLITTLGVIAIKNIITIDHLAQEINEYRHKYNALKNANELLRAEINRKSSMERITSIAQKDLGMILPKEQPVWISIDNKKDKDN